MLLQETYSIEDLTAYVTDFNNFTSATNKGSTYLFSDFELPLNHSIEFKVNNLNSSAIRISCGDTTHLNSSGYFEWIYAWYQSVLYYRSTTNSELSTSINFASDSRIFRIEYNGNNLKLFDENGEIKSVTSYDTLNLTRLLRIGSDSINSVNWIKIKPL